MQNIRITIQIAGKPDRQYFTSILPNAGDIIEFDGVEYPIEAMVWRIPQFDILIRLKKGDK